MNVKQALKQKTILASEIAKLYNLIKTNNSTIVGNPRHYSVKDLIGELEVKLEELVVLKSKIHRANAPVYYKIFLMSELKNKVNQLRSIDVTEGKDKGSRYNSEVSVYEVELNEKEINEKIKGVENEINSLQDELDTFNVMTQI